VHHTTSRFSVATWAEFQHSVVDYAVDQWRKRLEACRPIRAEGGQLNTCCDVACLTFQLPHITTGSFHSHQCQPTTSSFQSHERLEQHDITFSQMKKFCILQGSAVTFFRCGG